MAVLCNAGRILLIVPWSWRIVCNAAKSVVRKPRTRWTLMHLRGMRRWCCEIRLEGQSFHGSDSDAVRALLSVKACSRAVAEAKRRKNGSLYWGRRQQRAGIMLKSLF